MTFLRKLFFAYKYWKKCLKIENYPILTVHPSDFPKATKTFLISASNTHLTSPIMMKDFILISHLQIKIQLIKVTLRRKSNCLSLSHALEEAENWKIDCILIIASRPHMHSLSLSPGLWCLFGCQRQRVNCVASRWLLRSTFFASWGNSIEFFRKLSKNRVKCVNGRCW